MQPLLVPNDPLYSSQWHYMSPPLEKGGVNLPPAWDLTTGNASIVVAVIDTGSLAAHPDLAGRYVGGYDFISTPQIANDGDGRDSNPADPGDWITAAENALGLFRRLRHEQQLFPRHARRRHDRCGEQQRDGCGGNQLGQQDPAGAGSRQVRRLHLGYRRRDPLGSGARRYLVCRRIPTRHA